MKAQRLIGPGRFEVVDIQIPELDPSRKGQVLARVELVGICGSDLPAFMGKKSLTVDSQLFDRGIGAPGYPSHEVVGAVADSNAPDIPKGSMVVGWADGKNALADYVMLESRDVIAYDPVLSPVEAIVIQPLACVLHALWQIGDVRGKTAAVIGQGAIGLLFSHAAKSLGARRVIGIDRIDRSGRSGAFGVDEVVHLASDQWALGLTDHERPDVVIEAVGHQVGTLADAIDAVAFGGSILYFGIPDDVVYPVSVHGLIRKNLTLTAGTVPPDLRRRFLAEAEAYLLKHRALAGTLVTHRFSFEESAEAYRAATVPVSDQHKVVVELTPA